MMWALMQAALGGCSVVTGGMVYEADALVRADVVWVDERIVSVGPAVTEGRWKGETCAVTKLPEGAVVTPGFVDPWASRGVSEVWAESASVDASGEGDPIRAAMRVMHAYNPLSVHIPVARLQGITSSVVLPRDGMIAGQAGWAIHRGQTQAEAVVGESVAMVASLEGESKAQALASLGELLEDARAYRDNRAAVKANRFRPFMEGAGRADLEALIPVVSGSLPLVISANRASDIEAVLRLARTHDIRIILEGGAEAWRHGDALAASDTPVLLTPTVTGAENFSQIEGRADNAARLADAGVAVLFRGRSNFNGAALRFVAGNAVRAGLSHEAALTALTETPARVFAQPDRGVLRKGAFADVVAWSGDPLEFASRPLGVWIEGVSMPLESRHTALVERYRSLPGSPLPPPSSSDATP